MLGGVLVGAGIVFLMVEPRAVAQRVPTAHAVSATNSVQAAPIDKATAALPIETAAISATAADCCTVGPVAAGSSAGRSSASRSAPIWAADPPTFARECPPSAGASRRHPGRDCHTADFARAKTAGGAGKPFAAASARSGLSGLDGATAIAQSAARAC